MRGHSTHKTSDPLPEVSKFQHHTQSYARFCP